MRSGPETFQPLCSEMDASWTARAATSWDLPAFPEPSFRSCVGDREEAGGQQTKREQERLACTGPSCDAGSSRWLCWVMAGAGLCRGHWSEMPLQTFWSGDGWWWNWSLCRGHWSETPLQTSCWPGVEHQITYLFTADLLLTGCKTPNYLHIYYGPLGQGMGDDGTGSCVMQMTCDLKCPRPWPFYALNLLRWDLNIEIMLPVCVCCLFCLCMFWGGGKAKAHSMTVWLSGPVSDPLLSVVYQFSFWLTHIIHSHILLSVDGFTGCRPCAGCAQAVCKLFTGCVYFQFTGRGSMTMPQCDIMSHRQWPS